MTAPASVQWKAMRTAVLLASSFLITILSPAAIALAGEGASRDTVKPGAGGVQVVPEQGKRPGLQAETEVPVSASSGNDWQSPENEVKLGRFFAQQMDQTQKLIRDSLVNDYIDGVTQKLAHACGAPFPVSVKVFEADNVNAVALPGGFVYVTSGLVSAAEDESELAAILAHQIAHTCAHHLVRGMSSEEFKKATNPPVLIYTLNPSIVLGGNAYYALPPLTQNFPAKFEAEADALAVQYLYKAGFDPAAMLASFAGFDALEKANPDVVSKMFTTHLETAVRIRGVKKNLRALPRKDQYIVNSSEFDAVKARMPVLLAHRRKLNPVPDLKRLNR